MVCAVDTTQQINSDAHGHAHLCTNQLPFSFDDDIFQSAFLAETDDKTQLGSLPALPFKAHPATNAGYIRILSSMHDKQFPVSRLDNRCFMFDQMCIETTESFFPSMPTRYQGGLTWPRCVTNSSTPLF
jgi:hypothetical protein